jgi:hypothetical protein
MTPDSHLAVITTFSTEIDHPLVDLDHGPTGQLKIRRIISRKTIFSGSRNVAVPSP